MFFCFELRWLSVSSCQKSRYLRLAIVILLDAKLGFTYVKVQIANPMTPTRSDEVDLLVDSGAIFSSIPRNALEKLGLKPIDHEKLRVCGGAIVERDLGWAMIEYGGKRRVVPVIFGEPEDTPVFGSTSLESLGYQIDPVTRKLKPVELLMI